VSSQEHSMLKTLRAEHRHMGNVLKLLTEQLEILQQGEPVDGHVLYEIMDYVTTWPDRYHHPREDLIYARVAELDGQAADEVDTLQRDHDVTARRGQKLLNDIVKWQQEKLPTNSYSNKARRTQAMCSNTWKSKRRWFSPTYRMCCRWKIGANWT